MTETGIEKHHDYEPTPREPTREFILPRSLGDDRFFIENTLVTCGVYDARMIRLLSAEWMSLERKHLNQHRRNAESWKRFATYFQKEVKRYVGDVSLIQGELDMFDKAPPDHPVANIVGGVVHSAQALLWLGTIAKRKLAGNPVTERHLDPDMNLENLYEDFMRTEHDDGHLSVKLPE